MIKIGEKLPDFELSGFYNDEIKKFKLSDYRGKWVVLFSYPADFTFVCPTEIRGFNEKAGEFKKLNVQVLGFSVDSPWSHKAWVEKEWGKLDFPLLSDSEKNLIYQYSIDALDQEAGVVALRATFIVNPDGVLKYYIVSDNDVGRSVEETVRVLEALQTGKLCPVDWHHGERTLN